MMTNEEAIKLLMELRICKDDCSVCKLRHLDGDTHCHHEKALNLAIKALEQTKAKGEWKDIYAESEGSNSWIEFACPHCGNTFGMESGQYGWSYGEAIPWKACPMCGGLAEHEPYKAESEK